MEMIKPRASCTADWTFVMFSNPAKFESEHFLLQNEKFSDIRISPILKAKFKPRVSNSPTPSPLTRKFTHHLGFVLESLKAICKFSM